jgi:RNA polymerase sigma factor (sigma-70 family)
MASDNINTGLLIEQLQQGSERAFTRLYEVYSKPLYRSILRLVKEEQVARELLQDLFMKIWEMREGIDPGRSFKSFLYKVAENMVYGYFRQVARDRRLLAGLVAASVEAGINAEESMIARESFELLMKAIGNLSPQRKLVYMLCKLEGKSYGQVGRELGITASTISDHMVKANKAVKQYFLANQDIAVALVLSEFWRCLK